MPGGIPLHKSAGFDWNLDYLSGETPWETGEPAPELVRAVDLGLVAPGRVFEMGCGSGREALFLAGQGFSVTAADCSSIALARARIRVVNANADVRFLEADVCRFREEIDSVDFIFDRSCYEYLRHTDHSRAGYINTLRRITHAGSKFLLIVRRSRKKLNSGMDVAQIRAEFGEDFILDEVASARLRSAQDHSIRRDFFLTRQKASKSFATRH